MMPWPQPWPNTISSPGRGGKAVPRYVALLRGISLGKRTRMDVRALSEVLTGPGLDGAIT
jgi:hypothetical protein